MEWIVALSDAELASLCWAMETFVDEDEEEYSQELIDASNALASALSVEYRNRGITWKTFYVDQD